MNITRVLSEASPWLLTGMWMTIQTTVISLAIATLLGLFTCLAGMSHIKPLVWFARIYIWIIRGTPLLVQAFFIYFGVPQLIQSYGVDFRFSSVLVAGVITLSLNAGAYIAELFRGGIQAVDDGQMEAARSLGFSRWHAMYKVILPQAVRVAIPSLLNQCIITLKDTSIISVIGLAEIVYQAKIYIGRTMESFTTWAVVGAMYLIVVSLLTYLSGYIEKRLDHGKEN